MKHLILLLGLTVGLSTHAQKKEANLQQFNNFTASFEVPEGKTWHIYQIFSNFAEFSGAETKAVHIYIKTLNGDIKTDHEGNRFGPQVYQSDNRNATIAYPIVLPENTKFSLVMLTGEPGNCTSFNGTGYMSFYEYTNEK